jgi:hypothetical protein
MKTGENLCNKEIVCLRPEEERLDDIVRAISKKYGDLGSFFSAVTENEEESTATPPRLDVHRFNLSKTASGCR